MTDSDVLLEDSREWLNQHRSLAEIARRIFMKTGGWPTCADLQRELDRLSITDDVTQANNKMPRLPGQSVPQHDDHFRLPLHILTGMDAANGLMLTCCQIIWRIINLYHSDAEVPRLTNDDPQLSQEYSQDLLRKAIDVLRGSPPHPLGSGHSGSNGWSYEVDGQLVRHLTNIQSIDDYIAWQVETLRPSPTPVRKRRGRQADNDRWRIHLEGRYTIAAAIIGVIGLIAAAVISVYFTSRHDFGQNPPVTSSSGQPSSTSSLPQASAPVTASFDEPAEGAIVPLAGTTITGNIHGDLGDNTLWLFTFVDGAWYLNQAISPQITGPFRMASGQVGAKGQAGKIFRFEIVIATPAQSAIISHQARDENGDIVFSARPGKQLASRRVTRG